MTEESKETKTEEKEMTEEEKQKAQQEQFKKQMAQAFSQNETIFLTIIGIFLDGYLQRLARFGRSLGINPTELLKGTKETLLTMIENFEKQFAKKETKEEKQGLRKKIQQEAEKAVKKEFAKTIEEMKKPEGK